MPKYPLVLPWKAKQHSVEDDQAKVAWGYTKLLAMCLLAEDDYEFQNLQFDARLRTIGAINKIVAQVALMTEIEKYKLAFRQ
jgi:hypothetical protein